MYKSAPIPTSLAVRWRRGFDTLAIAVALQHLGADGFLDLCHGGLPILLIGVGLVQWADDIGINPQVELAHVVTLLFGHVFVPFGKHQCFGSGQLALLSARIAGAAWVPDPVKAPHTARPFDGLPCGALTGRA